jgi:hypothetical protein
VVQTLVAGAFVTYMPKSIFWLGAVVTGEPLCKQLHQLGCQACIGSLECCVSVLSPASRSVLQLLITIALCHVWVTYVPCPSPHNSTAARCSTWAMASLAYHMYETSFCCEHNELCLQV